MVLPVLDWEHLKIIAISMFFSFPFLVCIEPFYQNYLLFCQLILIIFQLYFQYSNHCKYVDPFQLLNLIFCLLVFDNLTIFNPYQANFEYNSCIKLLLGQEWDFNKNKSSHLQNNRNGYLKFLIFIKYYLLESRAIEIPGSCCLANQFPSCVLWILILLLPILLSILNRLKSLKDIFVIYARFFMAYLIIFFKNSRQYKLMSNL